jgi:hypothetical protein
MKKYIFDLIFIPLIFLLLWLSVAQPASLLINHIFDISVSVYLSVKFINYFKQQTAISNSEINNNHVIGGGKLIEINQK